MATAFGDVLLLRIENLVREDPDALRAMESWVGLGDLLLQVTPGGDVHTPEWRILRATKLAVSQLLQEGANSPGVQSLARQWPPAPERMRQYLEVLRDDLSKVLPE